jgi:hypothetical protein
MEKIKTEIPSNWKDGIFLIEYKGGGYDGCFWEWNFALIKNNEFFNVASSGYKGAETLEKLIERTELDDFNVYNLKNINDIKSFTKNVNEGLVIGVGEALYKEHKILMRCECDICGKEKNIHTKFHNTSYTGNGGIGVNMHGLVCDPCYRSHICNKCHEFSENIKYSSEYDRNLCEYCIDTLSKEEEKDEETEDEQEN